MQTRDLVLLDTRQTADAEHLAMADGVSGFALMERAGRAAADFCRSSHAEGCAAILCGPGNNGGDGFVVARYLRDAGLSVAVFSIDPAMAWRGEAAEARQRWAGDVEALESFDPARFDLIVDALFGAGLSRSIDGPAARAIEAVNASKRAVIAIDIPSGIDGNTGEVRGVAIKADATITFGTAKPGHYLYPGRAHRGQLSIADIGLPPPQLGAAAVLNEPVVWQAEFPWPDPDGHKYRRGHAVVLSGGLSHTGAARLAARAALRVGAGLVTLASPTEALAVNASHLTAVMLRAADGAAGLRDVLADARKNGVILGPGLGVGDATRAIVAEALAPQSDRPAGTRPRACLFDADALTSFAGDAASLRDLIGKAPGPVVITPHDGEFARLFSAQDDILHGGKCERTLAAAKFLGCTVLLKGADTVIAEPGGRAAISNGGAPWLATAGSGDVLSGMIGGLLTQGMPPFEAATAGDYLHTATAKLFGPGLIAEDLPDLLPRALQALYRDTAASRRDGEEA